VSVCNDTIRHLIKMGYKVDDNGNVFTPTGKVRNVDIDKKGYKRFSIEYKGTFRAISVHRVVAFQKYGEEAFKKEIQVRHKNGVCSDCTVGNILIGTASDNNMDKPEHVRKAVATKAAASLRKFTDSDIERIRELRKQGVKLNDIAEEYKVVKSTISYIINRRTYK